MAPDNLLAPKNSWGVYLIRTYYYAVLSELWRAYYFFLLLQGFGVLDEK